MVILITILIINNIIINDVKKMMNENNNNINIYRSYLLKIQVITYEYAKLIGNVHV